MTYHCFLYNYKYINILQTAVVSCTTDAIGCYQQFSLLLLNHVILLRNDK